MLKLAVEIWEIGGTLAKYKKTSRTHAWHSGTASKFIIIITIIIVIIIIIIIIITLFNFEIKILAIIQK